MKTFFAFAYCIVLACGTINNFDSCEDLPLYWWQRGNGTTNFGDELSRIIVGRIIGHTPRRANRSEKKLVALGSILHAAHDSDIIWGTGLSGTALNPNKHNFSRLDVRAVRGPLTRAYLLEHDIDCPELYGDPALALPLLFPEFKASFSRDYIIIPHIFDIKIFDTLGIKISDEHVVLPSEPWETVIKKILESKFVISSALHGIIVAEAFKIPARYLRLSEQESLLKYSDYYTATGRSNFTWATSVEQALLMGGEPEAQFDAQALLDAFPHDQFKQTAILSEKPAGSTRQKNLVHNHDQTVNEIECICDD